MSTDSMDCLKTVNSFCFLAAAGIQPLITMEQSILVKELVDQTGTTVLEQQRNTHAQHVGYLEVFYTR